MAIINLIDPNVWFQACEQWRVLFQCVMSMVMESLTISQHWDTLWYATIWGGGY
jgi:hypothetical protein